MMDKDRIAVFVNMLRILLIYRKVFVVVRY